MCTCVNVHMCLIYRGWSGQVPAGGLAGSHSTRIGEPVSTSKTAQVWLYGSPLPLTPPVAVRDDRFHIWIHEQADMYTLNGHHRCHWSELIDHTDLVEIPTYPSDVHS